MSHRLEGVRASFDDKDMVGNLLLVKWLGRGLERGGDVGNWACHRAQWGRRRRSGLSGGRSGGGCGKWRWSRRGFGE